MSAVTEPLTACPSDMVVVAPVPETEPVYVVTFCEVDCTVMTVLFAVAVRPSADNPAPPFIAVASPDTMLFKVGETGTV